MDALRQYRGFYIFESIVFIILGLLAIALPGFFTLSFELLVGILFLIGGFVTLFRSIKANSAGGMFVSFLVALLYILAGAVLLLKPLTGILSLTILVAILFFIQGIAQIWWGFAARSLGKWGWWIFSGLISIAIAALVWSGWPESAIWFIGLLVGINLLFAGITQLFITLEANK